MITKHCPHCDKNLALTDFQKNRCMKDGLEYWCRDCKSKDYAQRAANRAARGLCHCGQLRKDGYKTCEGCQTRVKEWMDSHPQEKHAGQKEWREAIKKQVFDHYGHACVCCGETIEQFLTIDHINGAGRKLVKASGIPFYHLIVKQGFPDDLQTLCSNCNHGRFRNGGICPHKSAV